MEGRVELVLANLDAGRAAYECSCEGSKCQYDPCHFDTHRITSDPSFSTINIVEHGGYRASLGMDHPARAAPQTCVV